MIRKGNRKRNKQIKSEEETFSKEVRSKEGLKKILSFLEENKSEILFDVRFNKVTKQLRLDIFCGAHVTKADLAQWKISNILTIKNLVTKGKKNISDDEINFKIRHFMKCPPQ